MHIKKSGFVYRMISFLIIFVFCMCRMLPVNAAMDQGVNYNTAGYMASTGTINCFPQKGDWINRDQWIIESNPDTGDEFKPGNMENEIRIGWEMPLEHMDDQIRDGLKYSINLEAFGRWFDFDKAGFAVDFWVKINEESRGYVTEYYYDQDIDGWTPLNFEGYVPESATYMRLRFFTNKYGKECQIYYRNIEVSLTDSNPPVPVRVAFGDRTDFINWEMRESQSVYGCGDEVYIDVLFNEPVFVNDPSYLQHTRSLNKQDRERFRNNLAVEYSDYPEVLNHTLDMKFKTPAEFFGDLQIEIKYNNSDGNVKTGQAENVDRSLILENTYDYSHLKKLRFKYTVRDGDEFKAEDITEITLLGGLITDNSYNTMPSERREITFDSSDTVSEDDMNTVYRMFKQNFKIETTAPVLLEINTDTPEGVLELNDLIKIYLVYSEPVNFYIPEDFCNEHGIDYVGKSIYNTYNTDEGYINLRPVIYTNALKDNNGYFPEVVYFGGAGTEEIAFSYDVHEDKADPLEVAGGELFAQIQDSSGDIKQQSLGVLEIMDKAGNKAPLLQGDVKLSDKKRYVIDSEPPNIDIKVEKADEDIGGHYITIDVEDELSGVDYDTVEFSYGRSGTNSNFKPVATGHKYHTDELHEMFDVEMLGYASYVLTVRAYDNENNFASAYEVIRNDTAGPTIFIPMEEISYFREHGGTLNFSITDNHAGWQGAGMGEDPKVMYKWVMFRTDPEIVEWKPAGRLYYGGAGYYRAEVESPAGYIFNEADLYVKAWDSVGNHSTYHLPRIIKQNEQYISLTYGTANPGHAYYADIKLMENTREWYDLQVKPKEVWYCMTEEPDFPAFNDNTKELLWRSKKPEKGKMNVRIKTWEDFNNEDKNMDGIRYMHVRVVSSNGILAYYRTIPEGFIMDWSLPEINLEANGSEGDFKDRWILQVYAQDDHCVPQDIKIKYRINTGAWKTLENDSVITLDHNSNVYNYITIEAEDLYGNINRKKFGPFYVKGALKDNKKPEAFVAVNTPVSYEGVAYTNEDFAELEVIALADEFSYSADGKNWSSWFSIKEKGYSEKLNYSLCKPEVGYGGAIYKAYVPLQDHEGLQEFFTRYRYGNIHVTDPVHSEVIRDVTGPSSLLSYSTSTITNCPVEAKPYDFKDNLCPSKTVKIEGEDKYTFRNNGTHDFVLKDSLGNKSIVTSEVDWIDTKYPSITISGTADGAVTSEAAATIEADDTGSGIDSLRYCWDTSPYPQYATGWKTIENKSVVRKTDPEGGAWKWYLHIKAEDYAGNRGTAKRSYIIDSKPPTIHLSKNGNEEPESEISTEIMAADSLDKTIEYVWSQTEIPPESGWAFAEEGTDVDLSDAEGTWYLHVKAVDAAENESVMTSNPFYMTKQLLSLNINTDTPEYEYVNRVDAAIDAEASSEISSIIYKWCDSSNKPETGWLDTSNHSEVSLAEVEGTWYIHAEAETEIGETVYVKMGPFYMDCTEPQISINPDGNESAQKTVSTLISAMNDLDTTIEYVWSKEQDINIIPGSDWVLKTDSDALIVSDRSGEWYLHIRAADEAGNEATFTSEVFYLYMEDLAISLTPSQFDHAATNVSIDIDVSAENTITSIQYAWTKSSSKPADGWTEVSNNTSVTADSSFTDGTWYLHVQAETDTGEYEYVATESLVLDNTLPDILLSDTGNSTPAGSASVTITADDTNIDKIEYAWLDSDDPAQVNQWFGATNGMEVNKSGVDGNWYLHVRVSDCAGNIAQLTSDAFVLYSSGLSINLGYNTYEKAVNSHNVEIEVSSSNSVTLLQHMWSSDSGQPARNDDGWVNAQSNPCTVTLQSPRPDGTWYLHVQAESDIGEYEYAVTDALMIDNTNPVVEISITGEQEGEITGSITATVDITDMSLCITRYAVTTETITPAAWNVFDPADNIVEPKSNGTWYVHVTAEDEAGNVATTYREVTVNNPLPATDAVYSGDSSGPVRAFLTTDKPVTVSEAFYDFESSASHTFEYSDQYGNEGTQTAQWTFEDYELWGRKADISISPFGCLTSGEVEIILEAPTDYVINDPDDDELPENYDNYLDILYGDNDYLNNYLLANKRVIVYKAVIAFYDGSDPEYYSGNGIVHTGDNFTYNGKDAWISSIYKCKFTTDINGKIFYRVDGADGADREIHINHIVDVSLEDNITTAAAHYDNFYANGMILASAGSLLNGYIEAGTLALISIFEKTTDILPPAAQITYTSENFETGPVTAKITLSDDSGNPVTILNNSGSSEYIFNQNGQFVFEFKDSSGNRGKALAQVSGLDTGIGCIDVAYSAKLPSKGPVKVTLLPQEDLELLNADVPLVKEGDNYYFETYSNGTWTFEFKDEAGYTAKVTAEVDNIDTEPPEYNIDYTNLNISKCTGAVVRCDGPFKVLNNNEEKHKLFESNGEFEFIVCDSAGNESVVTAAVDSFPNKKLEQSDIDINVSFSTTESTNEPVIIKLDADEPFYAVNTFGKNEVSVTKNGSYEFIIKDNTGLFKLIKADVKNIDKTLPVIEFDFNNEIILQKGDTFDYMDITATDNADGDITGSVEVSGSLDTDVPNHYYLEYSVSDSAGNTTNKTLHVTVQGEGLKEVYINGLRVINESLLLSPGDLEVSTSGFMGDIRIETGNGYRNEAWFKKNGIFRESNLINVTDKGWITLYITDSERNSKLVHILITETGGDLQ